MDYHAIQEKLQQAINALPVNSAALTVIGPTVSNSDDLYVSYNSAESILKCFMLVTPNVQNTILLADNIHNPSLKNVQYILNDILYDSSYESAQKKAIEFAYETFYKYGHTFRTSRTFLNEILYSIAHEIGKSFSHSIDIPNSFQRRFAEFNKILSQSEFIECMRGLVMDVRKVVRRETKSFSPIVNRALQYVNDNYFKPISTKQFSETCGVNASYFGYLFKKEMGLYFFEYINHVRIRHAENLLLTTNQTISAISAKNGFTDDSYFYKCFKKENGISPSKYRIMYKN